MHSLQGLETIFEAARVISDVALSSHTLNEQGGIYILEWRSQSGRGRLSSALVSVGDSKMMSRYADLATDGGGIRGYGSLLILSALMDKVGIEERRIDPAIKSSFSPCMYKPRFSTRYTEGIESFEARLVTETDPSGLSYDSLFLPCHYFDYGAGTSTGGYVMSLVEGQ